MLDSVNAPRQSRTRYVAIIGDMLGSRTHRGNERRRMQARFNQFIARLNRRYGSALASRFAVTLGDEFQGILKDGAAIPDLMWEVANVVELPQFRLGIGYGSIETAVPKYAINLDGPALHEARAAIDRAKAEAITGGVFSGFGEEIDQAANGVSRLLHFHLSRRSTAQLRVMSLLRSGHSQVEIAKLTDQTPQSVSQHKQAAGWEAFRAGEQGLCAILRLASSRSGR